MYRFLLGIDNGNTVTKVALFDLNGRELYVATRSADTLQPKPGHTERSMDTLWANTVSAIREVVARSGIQGSDIAAVGCTGHGNGLYLLDKQGRPFRDAIQSLDNRAAALFNEWRESDLRGQVFAYTPQDFYPAMTPTLLAWLKRHERTTYDQIGTVLFCKDYINYCLTGELASDETDMACSNMMDVFGHRYSPELFALMGIEEVLPKLPRLAQSLDVIGRVTADASTETGLVAGTPVIAGMIDIDASSIGAGVYQPGQACLIVGSWSINQVITETPIISRDLFLLSPFADPQYWLVTEGSATSASNLEWFVKHFCAAERLEAEQRGVSVYEVCNERVAGVPTGDQGAIFHPFLYGANVPGGIQAGFYGVVGWHTHAHLLRAVYEGIVFSHLYHVEKLLRAGATFDRARLSGGGARSVVWAQMFADALNMPLEIPDGFETGTRGAALSAGVGVGVYASLNDAAQNAITLARTHEPNPRDVPFYRERYQQYKALIERMSVNL